MRKWVTFIAAVACGAAALLGSSSPAEAKEALLPEGVFKTVKVLPDGALLIEIGPNVPVEAIIRAHGADYQRTTGQPLTLQLIREWNPGNTIPVCVRKGKRYSDGRSDVAWEGCKESEQYLVLVAGYSGRFKVKREVTETGRQKAEWVNAFDACLAELGKDAVSCLGEHPRPKFAVNGGTKGGSSGKAGSGQLAAKGGSTGQPQGDAGTDTADGDTNQDDRDKLCARYVGAGGVGGGNPESGGSIGSAPHRGPDALFGTVVMLALTAFYLLRLLFRREDEIERLKRQLEDAARVAKDEVERLGAELQSVTQGAAQERKRLLARFMQFGRSKLAQFRIVKAQAAQLLNANRLLSSESERARRLLAAEYEARGLEGGTSDLVDLVTSLLLDDAVVRERWRGLRVSEAASELLLLGVLQGANAAAASSNGTALRRLVRPLQGPTIVRARSLPGERALVLPEHDHLNGHAAIALPEAWSLGSSRVVLAGPQLVLS